VGTLFTLQQIIGSSACFFLTKYLVTTGLATARAVCDILYELFNIIFFSVILELVVHTYSSLFAGHAFHL
jgi:hypothetical protein